MKEYEEDLKMDPKVVNVTHQYDKIFKFNMIVYLIFVAYLASLVLHYYRKQVIKDEKATHNLAVLLFMAFCGLGGYILW